ncbi:1-phosphatidylinositol 3-phosphate 5-kinase [Anabrus simplex]|uniref:1-phosphatidylinositol 3-phosphate 5-kinase n=1 Tax=Anabrus simplex TaxID=316456 RepID=UPI0035A340DF
MSRNLQSFSKLTEFAPLSPETDQPGVGLFLSKLFKFNKGGSLPESSNVAAPTVPADILSSSTSDIPGNSGDWQKNENLVLSCGFAWGGADELQLYPPLFEIGEAPPFRVNIADGRNLPNVLKRISNLVALKSTGLQSYKDTDFKQYWMPDSVSKECYECEEKFTTFRRRHHCRVCGQIFCSKCCNQEIPGKIMGCTGDLRVCTYCCKVVLSYLQSVDMGADLSAELRSLQEDLQTKFGSATSPMTITSQGSGSSIGNSATESQDSSAGRRKVSVGFQEDRFALGRAQGAGYLSVEERCQALQKSASLRALFEDLCRPNSGINLQTHRYRLRNYQGCFLGSELVDWLLSQSRAATRIQATAIGQALIEGGFLECITDHVFTDAYALYRPQALLSPQQSSEESSLSSQDPLWVKQLPQQDSVGTDSESECQVSEREDSFSLPSSNSTFYLDLNVQENTVTLSRPRRDSEEEMTITQATENPPTHNCYHAGISNEFLSGTLWLQNKESLPKTDQPVKDDEQQAYDRLSNAYKQHEASLLKQLLNREGLSQSWADVLQPLVHRVVETVQPDVKNNDDMDVRRYVQFKKVPGGSRSESCIINGIVCTKNIAHRAMATCLSNPRILLLGCAIVYQRIEGRLLSLEPVMMQEREYLRNVVARIEALHPQLVLVHRNVSRLAQELLLQLGITLVLNVKTTALERVSRCTGADIVSSVDSHIGRPQLGTCRSFYLQVFNTEKGRRKTLMFFEGCSSPHLGCTVLLRGASNNELARLKKVAKLLVFARYSWRLELSFLMDEFACPPNPPKDAFFDDQSSPGLDTNDAAFDDNVPDSKPKQVLISKMDSVDDEDFKKETSASVIKVESEGLLVPKDAINIPISEKQLSVDSALRHPKLSEVGKQSAALCSICRGLRTTARDSLGMVGKSRSEETRPTFRNKSEPFKVDSSNITVERCVDETLAKDGLSNPRNISVCLCKVHVGRISSKDKSPSEEKRMNVESVSDFSDPLHSYLQLDDEVFGSEHHSGSPLEQLSVAELPLSNRFRKALDDTILSFSPYLTFSVPYLETEAGRSCVLWKYFPHEIFWSAQFSPVANSISSASAANNAATLAQDLESKLNIKLLPQHQFVSAKITSTMDNKEVQAMLAHFRACGGRLPLVPSCCQELQLPTKKADTPEQKESSWPDALDPSNHQRLAVLFCSYAHESSNAPAFCVNPWVVYMEFYGNNDIPLGTFLERYCFRPSYVCPSETCETPMMDHVRRFVHDNGCVHILLKELDQPIPGEGNDIHMWSWCSRCKTVSSVVPMSSDTWSLSFAKFLELRFHGYMYTRRGPETPCLHSLHHDHLLYFGYKNIVASFKYTSINPWEISLPPPLVSISYDPQQQAKVVEEIKKLTLKGYDVYSNIRERLYSLGMEMEGLGALIQQLQREETHYESRIKEIQLKLTSPTLEAKKLEGKLAEKDVQQLMWHIEDAVVQVKRLIADIVVNWNARLQDLVAHSRKKDEKSRKSEGSKTYTQTSSVSTDCDEVLQEVAVEATSPTSLEVQYNDLPSPTGIVAVPITGPLEGEDSFVINFSSQDPSSTTEQVSQETAEQPVTPKGSRDEPVPVIHIVVTEESGSPAPSVVQPSSPKTQLRQHSESTDDGHEGKPAQKIVKTILSQLRPSAAGITPIQSPLSPQEHHLAPGGYSVPVVVYETEPSSIIAYALSSQEYRRSLEELRTKRISASEQPTPSPVHKRKLGQSLGDKDSLSDSTQLGDGRRSGVLSFLRGSSTSGNNSNRAGVLDGVQYSTSGSTGDSGSVESEEPAASSKNSKVQPSQHIEVFFSDASTNFFCRVYFVEHFAALRQAVLPVGDEGFVRSLARCVPWPARGGKSGSTFCKTKDDRFVLKEMSRLEMQLFLDFAHHYFSYIQHCHSSRHPTLLGKIVGVYRIKFRNANTTLASNLLVMENLFYSRTVTHKFDLKGSIRNRLVNPATEREGEIVLLDENLLKMTCDSPLYIYPHSKTVLMQAINSDTKFLASQSVMDYSLLVGLDQERKELVVGIIDYIRTYTWDKKLEAMVKYYGNLGGGQGKLPTVVSPELYRARFIAAMHRYFLPVPDRWAGLGKGLEC